MILYGQVSRRRHDLNIHQLLTNSLSKMKKCSYVKTRVTLFITNETQHDSSWPAVYSILMSDEVNSNMTSLLTSQWYQHAQKTFFESQTLYKSTDRFHAVNIKQLARKNQIGLQGLGQSNQLLVNEYRGSMQLILPLIEKQIIKSGAWTGHLNTVFGRWGRNSSEPIF